MPTIKKMPTSEKYAKVRDIIAHTEAYVPPFIEEQLGHDTVAELQRAWREGVEPIPPDAPAEEKYERAYRNLVWIERTYLRFIRERMGEGGIESYMRAAVEANKRKAAGPALFILGLIRAVAPNLAFSMTAKQTAYELQWFSPFDVPELTRERAVLDIPRCKVLDYSDTEEICSVICQGVYPLWFAEQYKTKLELDRRGNSCTCTVSRLRNP